MEIEVKFLGDEIVMVRPVSSSNMRQWDELKRGSVHTPTGLSWDALRELGEGVHEVEGESER